MLKEATEAVASCLSTSATSHSALDADFRAHGMFLTSTAFEYDNKTISAMSYPSLELRSVLTGHIGGAGALLGVVDYRTPALRCRRAPS
jgi:hypothetical protein